MEDKTTYPYFAIVTFGCPSYGRINSYYRSYDRALRDASKLGGGSMTNVRILGCKARRQAVDADISGNLPVVHSL